MRIWQVQEAKARFSELLETASKEGPQVVTRRGVEAAVIVPIAEWRRLQQGALPTLKEMLLADEARFAATLLPRRRWRRRPPAAFDWVYLLDTNVVSELRRPRPHGAVAAFGSGRG